MSLYISMYICVVKLGYRLKTVIGLFRSHSAPAEMGSAGGGGDERKLFDNELARVYPDLI